MSNTSKAHMTGSLRQRGVALLLCLAAHANPVLAEIVVVANPRNPTVRALPAEIRQVYFGASDQFLPIEREESSAIRAEFYKKVLGKERSQVMAIWAKLVFTGRGSIPKVYQSSSAVKRAISVNTNAIGYIEKSAVDDTVKIIAVVP